MKQESAIGRRICLQEARPRERMRSPTETYGAAGAGDHHSVPDFGDLYERHFQPLVWFLRNRGCEAMWAEDLAQEALLRALRNLHRYDPDRPFGPWLRTIARRLLANDASVRRREVPSGLLDTQRETSPADPHAGQTEPLEKAFAQLSERHRLALGLRYVAEHSPEEAASAMSLSTNAFHQLMYRARRRLRQAYIRFVEELPAVALLPMRWLDRLRSRVAVEGNAQVGSRLMASWTEPAHQVASGLIALLLFAGPVGTSRSDIPGVHRTPRASLSTPSSVSAASELPKAAKPKPEAASSVQPIRDSPGDVVPDTAPPESNAEPGGSTNGPPAPGEPADEPPAPAGTAGDPGDAGSGPGSATSPPDPEDDTEGTSRDAPGEDALYCEDHVEVKLRFPVDDPCS